MAMPFGVSIGDFVTGIDFIRSAIEALESTTGSQAQYQGLISSLTSLKDALGHVATIEATDDEKRDVDEIIRRMRQTFSKFERKLQKYDSSLGKDQAAAKWWKSFPRKIQWQRYTKEDVRCIQDELFQYFSALQLLTEKIQMQVFRLPQRTERERTANRS